MYKKILYVFIAAYIIFFSVFSVLRYRNLYANYFDLGIMHHVVYNSYKALQTGELGRFLEHTDPNGYEQVARSAVHNDIILALFAPLYFIYPSPEILLVTQSVVLGLGALAVYGIGRHVFRKNKKAELYSLIFSVSYLLYVPLQFMNRFEFHSVALSTSFLLFMFYFWLEKKYKLSLLFLILSLITKEQVGLTTAMMGGYMLLNSKFKIQNLKIQFKTQKYPLMIIAISLVWVALSFFVIIPYFSGGDHFATNRYDLNQSANLLFRKSTWDYLWNLLAPLGFLSLLSPIILIALPELGINLLSKNEGMRMIIFHYTALITPFVFISAMYGLKRVSGIEYRVLKKYRIPNTEYWILAAVASATLWFSFTQSPLPYSQQRDLYVFSPQQNAKDSSEWAYRLQDDSIPVAATGNVGTMLSSRRRFYYFSKYYNLADYVIIRPNEIYRYHDKKILIPVYERLIRDPQYVLIDMRENFEVYKKI